MDSISEKNKRIAKNTIFLYLRMLFTVAISLYTSRMVLNALGVADFGVYDVVGGVVTMMGFVNSTLIGASARFITFSQGTGNKIEIQKTFDCIVTLHYIFAILILILCETIGLWFVSNKLVVPDGRMDATIWVYQCAVIAALIEFISTPYNSLIVAHEKMSAFAFVSIYDKCIQLVIAFILLAAPYDRLIIYSVLIVIAKISVRLIYTLYCHRKFEESKYHLCLDKTRIKPVLTYAGWIFNGNLAFLGYTQGLNILLNLFFGPIVNAARGISQQVQVAIYSFTNNFQTAINPQIIKSYAASELTRMHNLVLMSSRFGFFLMLIIALPIYFNTNYILNLWLTEVPEYSGTFIRMILIIGLNSTLRNPTITAIQATGNVKKFQIWEGSLLLLIIPIAYVLLKCYHINPVQTLSVYMFTELAVQFVRVFITYPQINLHIWLYFTKILWPCIKVLAISATACHLLTGLIHANSISMLITYVVASLAISGISIWLFGINKNERRYVVNIIANKVHKLKRTN